MTCQYKTLSYENIRGQYMHGFIYDPTNLHPRHRIYSAKNIGDGIAKPKPISVARQQLSCESSQVPGGVEGEASIRLI